MGRLLTEALALLAGLAVLVVGTTVLQCTRTAELQQLQARNDLLAEEIRNLEMIVGDVRAYEAQAAALTERSDAIAALRTVGGETPRAMAAIEAAMPRGAYLDSLVFTDGRMTLTGVAPPELVASLVEGLQSSGCFDDVAMSTAGAGFQVDGSITAESCPDAQPGLQDLFEPPPDPEAVARSQVHPVVRWEARSYRVVATEAGAQAIVTDPDGGSHLLAEGSMLGAERAKVTYITEDQVILTWDEVVDPETRQTRSHIVTLRLEAE